MRENFTKQKRERLKGEGKKLGGGHAKEREVRRWERGGEPKGPSNRHLQVAAV